MIGRLGLSVTARDHIDEMPLFRRNIAEELARFAAATAADGRVLDAGAGEAPYRSLFAHCEYVTADWPNSPHPRAREADILADLRELPVEDESFDAVVLTEVLEHVADPAAVLRELSRVLRPGGRLFVTVPFVIYLHETPYDYARYTGFGLESLLDAAGFSHARAKPMGGVFSVLAIGLQYAAPLLNFPPGSGRLRRAVARRVANRAVAALSRYAPRLDKLDRSSALPLGWAIEGVRAPIGPSLAP